MAGVLLWFGAVPARSVSKPGGLSASNDCGNVGRGGPLVVNICNQAQVLLELHHLEEQGEWAWDRLGIMILCCWGKHFQAISGGRRPVLRLEQTEIEAPFINAMLFLLVSPDFDIIRLGAMLAMARRGRWAREAHDPGDEDRAWFVLSSEAPLLPETTI